MRLERVGPDPVLVPRKGVPWEKDAVSNGGADTVIGGAKGDVSEFLAS